MDPTSSMTSTFSPTATESQFLPIEETIIPKASPPTAPNYNSNSYYADTNITIALTVIITVTSILCLVNFMFYRFQKKHRQNQHDIHVNATIIHTNPLHSVRVEN